MHPTLRVFLVDDSPSFLEAVQNFLDIRESFEVAGTATEENDALIKARQLQPDVILLDLNLGEQSGLDLVPLFKKHIPKVKVIIVTFNQGEHYSAAAIQAGADAFVCKTDMIENLVPIIFEITGASK